MSRDDRPYFHTELGIPWDEYQLACWIASEGAVDQLMTESPRCTPNHHWIPTLFSRIADDDQVADMAAKFARRASRRLRSGR